jgi:hypothetical protein
MSVIELSTTTANASAVEETSYSSPVYLNISDRELDTPIVQVLAQTLEKVILCLKKLHLEPLSELTPTKWRLHGRIRNKECVLCKLKKKYKARESWKSSVIPIVIQPKIIFHLL